MTEPQDVAMWRNRFVIIQLSRIGGTVVALLGILLWQADTFVQGGHIAGFPLALAGLAISFGAPVWLARRWRTPPPE
ncbi:hypothetical protein [Sphingosinicella sp.]|uniref:hypothetical protein n=1 Tax=Sphingosinicella sp. TaxID=1917971 RepID=UPI004037D1FE